MEIFNNDENILTVSPITYEIISTQIFLFNYYVIQDKIVGEIQEIFGDSNRVASMEDLNKMKYLECCIKETLRLYPSVHLIGRQFGEKIKLSKYQH